MVKYFHRYRVDIFLVVLDSLFFEMNERFSESSTNLLKCITYLDNFFEFISIYSADFSSYDRTFLRGELGKFISDMRNSLKFSNCHDLATIAIQMIQTEKYLYFPLVYHLIEHS
jgi:hypothetical protein